MSQLKLLLLITIVFFTNLSSYAEFSESCGKNFDWLNASPLEYGSLAWSEELSQFITVAYKGAIATSPDGTIWEPQTSGVSTSFDSVVWNGSHYIVENSGSGTIISQDGITWEESDVTTY